jgi:hypothetical protein
MSFGFDKFEDIVKKSQPLASKIYGSVGQPVVNHLDVRVNRLVGKLHSSSALPIAVTSNWLRQVDENLKPHIDVTQSYAIFLQTSTGIYVQLYDKALASAVAAQQLASDNVMQPVIVKYEDFQAALQARLVRAWDSSLAHAAQEAYTSLNQRAQTLTAETTARIRDARDVIASQPSLMYAFPQLLEAARAAVAPLESSVVAAFNKHLGRPAYALYNYCTDTYMSLAAAAREKGQELAATDVTLFLERIKAQLGNAYTVQLEQLLREYFAKAVQARDALKTSGVRVLSAWGLEKGQIMLQEYYFATKNAAKNLTASFGWGAGADATETTEAAAEGDAGSDSEVEVVATALSEGSESGPDDETQTEEVKADEVKAEEPVAEEKAEEAAPMADEEQ